MRDRISYKPARPSRCLAVRARRDHRVDSALGQIGADFVAVIPFVAEKLGGAGVVKLDQRAEALRVVDLAPGDIEGQRIAFGIGAEMDFGREAAARAPQRLLLFAIPRPSHRHDSKLPP